MPGGLQVSRVRTPSQKDTANRLARLSPTAAIEAVVATGPEIMAAPTTAMHRTRTAVGSRRGDMGRTCRRRSAAQPANNPPVVPSLKYVPLRKGSVVRSPLAVEPPAAL